MATLKAHLCKLKIEGKQKGLYKKKKKKSMLAGKQHTQLQHPKLLNSIVAHWSTSLSFFFHKTTTGLPHHHVYVFN